MLHFIKQPCVFERELEVAEEVKALVENFPAWSSQEKGLLQYQSFGSLAGSPINHGQCMHH